VTRKKTEEPTRSLAGVLDSPLMGVWLAAEKQPWKSADITMKNKNIIIINDTLLLLFFSIFSNLYSQLCCQQKGLVMACNLIKKKKEERSSVSRATSYRLENWNLLGFCLNRDASLGILYMRHVSTCITRGIKNKK